MTKKQRNNEPDWGEKTYGLFDMSEMRVEDGNETLVDEGSAKKKKKKKSKKM